MAQHRRIRPGNAEGHRIGHRRAEQQSQHAHPRRGIAAGGDVRLQRGTQAVARGRIGGLDHQLGERRIGQLGVEREVEARRAGADEAVDRARLGMAAKIRLDPRHDLLGRAYAGAARHVDFDQQLGPVGRREELLGNHRHQQHCGEEERPQRDQGHGPALVNTPRDPFAQPLIARRGVNRIVPAGDRGNRWQQLHPKVGREIDRDQPRDDQREADDPEDIAGIFACARLREANRQKADDGDDCAGQHRRSSGSPGEGCGLGPAQPLFHFDDHHLDCDDRIVDQQPKAEDQRAERNSVEIAARHQHDHEHRGKRQRDRCCDDDANPEAERDQADDHHHTERDRELQHEFAVGFGNVVRLVRDLGHGQAEWQASLDRACGFGQVCSELAAVPPLAHDYAQDQRRGTGMTDNVSGRVFIAAPHLGDVAQPEHPSGDSHRGGAHRIEIVERAVHPQLHALRVRFHRRGRAERVLGGQRIDHRVGADPQRRQLAIG